LELAAGGLREIMDLQALLVSAPPTPRAMLTRKK
jgi:hypothetical protein